MPQTTVDTPRQNSWAATVNDMPTPKMPVNVIALGTCDRDGSNFKPYPQPRHITEWEPGMPLGLIDRRCDCDSLSCPFA